MNIIEPSAEIMMDFDPIKLLKKVEACGRLCYKSEERITGDSYVNFVNGVIKRGHLSVVEHGSITVKVICDRGVSHEIVRHRIGSYSQESTRYVRYDGLTVIKPCYLKEGTELYDAWIVGMQYAEDTYRAMMSLGAKPEEARAVLPNSIKTEIAITFNIREWRHFLELRGSKSAHPQIRQIAIMILCELQKNLPVGFSDYVVKGDVITNGTVMGVTS